MRHEKEKREEWKWDGQKKKDSWFKVKPTVNKIKNVERLSSLLSLFFPFEVLPFFIHSMIGLFSLIVSAVLPLFPHLSSGSETVWRCHYFIPDPPTTRGYWWCLWPRMLITTERKEGRGNADNSGNGKAIRKKNSFCLILESSWKLFFPFGPRLLHATIMTLSNYPRL